MTPNFLPEHLASDAVIDEAFRWLCRQRRDRSPNNDVWTLRHRWDDLKSDLQRRLRSGRYRFSPVDVVQVESGERIECWCACDALVLKALSIVLGEALRPHLSPRCFHLRGHGGNKGAVREVCAVLATGTYHHVFRSDVKRYYASIHHAALLQQLRRYVDDPVLLDLVCQYLHRTLCRGGCFRFVRRGISLGCSLSPPMGALYLDLLDKRMESLGVFYVRFVDDWVILAPTRWKLRDAIWAVNQTLEELRVEQHPDKTFVGRVGRGFDFLGYRFTPQGLGVAPQTLQKFAQRVTRLYEQGASRRRLGQYAERWQAWVGAGLFMSVAFVAEKPPAGRQRYKRQGKERQRGARVRYVTRIGYQ